MTSTTMTPAGTLTSKHDARRRALAESALQTLGELGYARSSLREIANNSEFSHGVVHYYFEDKLDLIVFCVRQYKATCVHRYDGVIASADSADALVAAFADKLVETIVDGAPMHRLWYDLRAQSMFEEGLRDAVLTIDQTLRDMIGRVVTTYAFLSGRESAMSDEAAYGLLDGLFQQALLGHLTGRADALETLRGQVHELMPVLLSV
jgi:AcrR family transcriptional regulator